MSKNETRACDAKLPPKHQYRKLETGARQAQKIKYTIKLPFWRVLFLSLTQNRKTVGAPIWSYFYRPR